MQQRAAETLAEDGPAVVLAATIPADPTRANLRRFLLRHWSEGPQALVAAAVADHLFVEPGLIAVLKSAAREAAPPKAAAIHHFGKAPRTLPKAASTKETDWDKSIQDLVENYCRRCRATALARGGAAPSRESRIAAGLIPMYAESKVLCAYHFDWPDGNADSVPQFALGAWQLDYVRIEARTRVSRPLAHYREQVKHAVEHRLPNGLWLDGFSEGAGQERTRSVDVLITALPAGAASGPNAERELTVEVLSVDVGRLRE
jgi:hypothetical protein